MSQFRVITPFYGTVIYIFPKYRLQGDSDESTAVWHDDSCLTSCLMFMPPALFRRFEAENLKLGRHPRANCRTTSTDQARSAWSLM